MTTATLDQNAQRSASLLEDLWNDPEYGPAIRARAKKKFPDIRTPEDTLSPVVSAIDAKHKALEDKFTALQKSYDDRLSKEADETSFRALQTKVDSAVAKFGLTDEGRTKMLDRMKETGNLSDPDAAAALIAHASPPVVASGPNWAPKKLDLFGSARKDEKFEALHRDPMAFMDSELEEFAANPDKYVAETFGRAA